MRFSLIPRNYLFYGLFEESARKLVTAAEVLAVIAIVAVALGFDFMNGFHDAANSVATIVSTRVLGPARRLIGPHSSTLSPRLDLASASRTR